VPRVTQALFAATYVSVGNDIVVPLRAVAGPKQRYGLTVPAATRLDFVVESDARRACLIT